MLNTISLTHSVLLTGASGVGKSTLIRGALEQYGSGAVVLAPGKDESDSYVGLLDRPEYRFGDFDDILFQPALNDWVADGHKRMVEWLKQLYLDLRSDLEAGKPLRYAVLGIDTLSAIGRLGYNATMAKFKKQEPPPARSPDGAAFYSHLRFILESGVRLMRAIRGLGVHWIAASHPTEAETTAIQQTADSSSKSKIMPDVPGGFKNQLPSFFTTVVDVNIAGNGKRYARWAGDPKRVTKSRLGSLSESGKIDLPSSPKEAWLAIASAVDMAMERLIAGSK